VVIVLLRRRSEVVEKEDALDAYGDYFGGDIGGQIITAPESPRDVTIRRGTYDEPPAVAAVVYNTMDNTSTSDKTTSSTHGRGLDADNTDGDEIEMAPIEYNDVNDLPPMESESS